MDKDLAEELTTITITLHLSADLARLIGQHKLPINLPSGASLMQLITTLQKTYPALKHKLKNGEQNSTMPYSYFVNKKIVKPKQTAKHQLNNGDHIHIIIAVAGG